jgi:hypothetical protein
LGFGGQRHLARGCPPDRRFTFVQVTILAPASFRSLIGPSTAESFPSGPSLLRVEASLRAPLPSPTGSLLPRALAGLAPASRLACRSHAGYRYAPPSLRVHLVFESILSDSAFPTSADFDRHGKPATPLPLNATDHLSLHAIGCRVPQCARADRAQARHRPG